MDKDIIPFFSIAIPTYDMNGIGVDCIKFNIKQILAQSFTNYEVVISDQSPTDSIKQAVESFNDPRIKYYKHDGKGIASNTNNAIKNSKGIWIKILYQDDFLFKKDALKITKEAINPDGNHLGKNWVLTTCCHTTDRINGDRIMRPCFNPDLLNGVNTISSPSVVTIINIDLFKEITKINIALSNEDILVDENLSLLLDCEWYVRLRELLGDPIIVNDITVVNYNHPGQAQHHISKASILKEKEYIKEKYGNRS